MTVDHGCGRFEILKAVELAGLEFAGLQRCFHHDVHDRRRQAFHFHDKGTKLLVERCLEPVEYRIAFRLRQRSPFGELVRKDLDDLLVPMFGRGHRLYDVAGVLGVVVAVISDEFAVFLVGGEKSRLDFFRRNYVERAIAVFYGLVREEKLPPLVELERAGVLLFVNDVRRSSRGDAYGACREFDHLAGLFELARLGGVVEPLEDDGLDGVEFVRDGFGRVHAFDEFDPFF